MRAIFDTTKGQIICELFSDQTPKTVENFAGLAEGTKEWTDPRTSRKVNVALYNDTVFHRVIPNFMIQGGDPLGMGHGGPGYMFEDEIVEELKFDRAGRLAMANRGPNTNGSQFFITHGPTPWLNGRHTIFGQVVEGQDVVEAIGQTPRGSNDRPVDSVTIRSIVIERA